MKMIVVFNGFTLLRYYYLLFLVECFFLLMNNFVCGVPIIATRNGKEIILIPDRRFFQIHPNFNSSIATLPLQSYYIERIETTNNELSGPTSSESAIQQRGPLEFIGQLIQQIPFLPIQINVPDVIQNIGNGIGQFGNGLSQFSQNVTNGFTQFTQNVGTGLNQFGQNVGTGINSWAQNIPFLNNVFNNNNNNRSSSAAVPILVFNGAQQIARPPVEYPGGQQLILADDAFDIFP